MPELTPSSEDVRVYELTILYPYPLGQKEEATLKKDIDALFEEYGVKIIDKDEWGRRGLAYSIGGFDEGCYIVYYLEMDPTKLKEFDEALRITPSLLRHIIIKPPKGYQVVKFSKEYETWLKNRESEGERMEREREEEIKKRVADKAKRQAKKAETQKKETEETAQPVDEAKLTGELEKIISDDELDI